MKKEFSEENIGQTTAEELVEQTEAVEDIEEVVEEVGELEVEDIEELRRQAKPKKDHRKLRYGSMATVMTVIVIVAAILLNVVVGILDDRFPLTLDLTEEGLYTLSAQSEEIAKSLKLDVEVLVFAAEEEITAATGSSEYDIALRQFHQGLKSYESLSGGRLKVRYLDVSGNPLLANEYEEYGVSYGSILFRSVPAEGSGVKEKYRTATVADLVTQEAADDYYYTGSVTYTSNAEQVLAKNINAVGNMNNVKAMLFTGHGEESSTVSSLTTLLTENGYELETIDPRTEQEFSEEAITIFLPAPTVDYTEEELEKIRLWLENEQDGVKKRDRSLVLIVSAMADCPELYDFVNTYYGIEITNNLVAETQSGRYYSYDIYPMADIASTDHTASLVGQYAFAPFTRQLILHKGSDSEASALTNHPLMTFPSSARLLDLAQLTAENTGETELEYKEADSYPIAGMAYAYEYSYDNSTGSLPTLVETNVLVCGSELMFDSSTINMRSFANELLLMQTINGVAGNDDAVTVSTRSLDQEYLEFSSLQSTILFWTLVVAVPAILLIVCLVVFLKRRHM